MSSEAPSVDPPIPYIDDYPISQRLGRGGYASVWLGWRRGPMGFFLPVALKVLDPEHAQNEAACRRFFAEARLLAALEHPNIISVLDAGQSDGRAYYVMEYVRGTSLADLLQVGHRMLPLDAALMIATRIGAALHSAHTAAGPEGQPLAVVHRDVNPANILLGRNGIIKLIDFGIAVSSLGPRDTRVNIIKGNPFYLSPEQAFGVDVDVRSDIYSLALTLYETVTGVAPLASEDRKEAVNRARQPEIKPPSQHRPSIPAQVEDTLMRALARDPNDRFRTADEFVRALRACLVGINASMAPESLDLVLSRLRLPDPKPPGSAGTARIADAGVAWIDDDINTGVYRQGEGDSQILLQTAQPLNYVVGHADYESEDEPTQRMQALKAEQ